MKLCVPLKSDVGSAIPDGLHGCTINDGRIEMARGQHQRFYLCFSIASRGQQAHTSFDR
jgi:hypothetical protein